MAPTKEPEFGGGGIWSAVCTPSLSALVVMIPFVVLCSCLVCQHHFPPWSVHVIGPKNLCHLARKYEGVLHLCHFVAEIHHHESSIISYINNIPTIVMLFHPLAPKKYHRCLKWPIIQFQDIL